MTIDPLTDLLVDETDLARDELAAALKPFVRFTSGGEILLNKEFSDLSTLHRTCCILLAGKALHLLELRDQPEFQNQEITALTGMPAGTVGPKLIELKRNRLAVRNDNGWTVPLYAVRDAVELFEGRK